MQLHETEQKIMSKSDLHLATTKARNLFNVKPFAFYKVNGKYVSSYNNLRDLLNQRDAL